MPTPAEMLPQAEALLGDPSAPRHEPWIIDQHEAAAAELDPLMRKIVDDMGKPLMEGDGDPRMVAFAMAVTLALLRRRRPERCCEHSQLLAPPPLLAFLGPGVIACEPCMRQFLYAGDEDERCDICDARTKTFHNFWIRIGPSMVHGDGCIPCVEWLESLPGTGG